MPDPAETAKRLEDLGGRVAEPQSITRAIEDHRGRVGPARSAGIYTTQACQDDQGTAFSLWYQPTSA